MSSLDYIDLCRLCLVKDHVNVPIFEGEGDVRQIFLKIAACLPVKVAREDKLPKKICDDCVYKVESFYQFWNTTASAEKQLFQWIGEDNLEDKQGYVEQNSENRFGSNVIQVAGNQNNMDIRLMDNMGLGMPIIISSSNQQQISSVPLDSADNSVTQSQAVPSSSSHEQMSQSQTNIATQEDDDDESDDDNMDDECDGDEGLSVKEEGEDELNSNKNIESTTFVNVGMTCDQAGPSGLQQQKITEMTDIGLQQTSDDDPKSGYDQAESRKQKQDIKEEKEKGPSSEPDIVPKQESEAEDVKKRKNVCSQCSRVFRTAVSLRKHMKKHTNRKGQSAKGDKNEQEFMCKTCDKVFRHKSNYQKHLLRHTVGDLTCKHCPKKFRLFRDLTRHEKTHFFPSYVCKECDYETTVLAALSIHMLRHTDKAELPFKCTDCDKRFRKAIDLQEHYNIHSGEKPFDCQICGSAFCLRRQLSAHCRRLHPEIKANKITSTACDICGRVLATKRSLFRHKESHNPTKLYLCDFCGKSLSSAEHLKKHRRIHTGEKPYVCDICGKGFTDSENLRMHRAQSIDSKIQLSKISELDFSDSCQEEQQDSISDSELEKVRDLCPLCDTRFESVQQMEEHVKNVHMRRFVCDICKKSCASRRGLEKHKETHKSETYYSCDICQRKYKSALNLKRHEIRSHSQTQTSYCCDHCGRSYRQKFDLIIHLKRVHESESRMCRFCGREVKDIQSHEWRHQKRTKDTVYAFPCNLCMRKFHSKTRLENHRLIHERKFECDECGKECKGPRELGSHKRKHVQPVNSCVICNKNFTNVSNFYQHVLTHAGIRPYKCDICSENFTQRSSLIRHRKNHPGPLPKLVTEQPQIAELARSYLSVVTSSKETKED